MHLLKGCPQFLFSGQLLNMVSLGWGFYGGGPLSSNAVMSDTLVPVPNTRLRCYHVSVTGLRVVLRCSVSHSWLLPLMDSVWKELWMHGKLFPNDMNLQQNGLRSDTVLAQCLLFGVYQQSLHPFGSEQSCAQLVIPIWSPCDFGVFCCSSGLKT